MKRAYSRKQRAKKQAVRWSRLSVARRARRRSDDPLNGDPIEWDKAVTKKVTPVTKCVTSAPPVTKNVTRPRDGLSGGVCPTCGHRMSMTAAERKRAERARKRAADPA